MNEEEKDFESQEMYEHHRFVSEPGQKPLRVDKFLMNLMSNTTRNKVQNAAKAGNILVNDKPAKSNHKVKPGDVVSVVLSFPPRELKLIAEDIPLNIIYEDKDVLIVNKEAGMVVHPAHANYDGTMLNALLYHFDKNNEPEKPHLVHRIDKNTSGLLIVTKNELAQSKIAKQFFDHSTQRKYHALVWGDFNEEEGTIEGNIGRHPKNRKIMTVFPDGDYGKEAITHYKVLERFGYVTLLECQLETGRTHQIRAHMKFIGHPLFNDATYGGDKILKGTTYTKYKQFVQNCFKLIPRQSLHAKSIGFVHPTTGKDILFESELPEDFTAAIEKWRHYAVHKLQ
ncbi:MAG: RluA family pseudouridine synthase [Bacteroidota bacterium]|nr:RluA family pseudouridine synthase [Bacteroidota bacterium]